MEEDLPVFKDESESGQSKHFLAEKDFFRENAFFLFFGLLGFIFLSAGLFSFFQNSNNQNSEIIIEKGEEAGGGMIKVDIAGAVIKPGVYELNSGSRIQDVLVSAGGLSSSADRDFLAKNLNLAAKLSDGVKIYIPQIGEVKGGLAASVLTQNSGKEMAKININTAPAEELDKLPGVGPVTAQKIIEGRPYQETDDLKDKKIVSSSTFGKIESQITVW